MSSTLIQIADAVTAAINASGLLPAGVTAIRGYRPVVELEDLVALHVTVVPKGVTLTGASRSLVQHDFDVDVGVQKRLPSDVSQDQAELDALMALVEQLGDYFRLKRLDGLPSFSAVPGAWTKSENSPVFAPDHLEQMRVFTSVLTLTFRVHR